MINTTLRTLSSAEAAGVLIAGGNGSGKSHLLRAIVDDRPRMTPSDQPVVLWAGSGQRREVDLLLGHCREIIGNRRRAVLLVADDLEQWESPALSALSHGIDSDGLRLVGAVRDGQLSPVLGMLRPSRTLTLIRLAPWRVIDLLQHAADVLGGRLHPLSARRLIDFSGGNPHCLMELLREGRSAGRLRCQGEMWWWHGRIAVPPITRARIRDELGRCPGAVIEVLITLASTGPMPIERLLTLHDHDQLGAAERAGYLCWSADGATVSVQPLAGRVALAGRSPWQRRRPIGDVPTSGASAAPARPDPQRVEPDAGSAQRAVVELGRGRILDALRSAQPPSAERTDGRGIDMINIFVIGSCLLLADERDELLTTAAQLCRRGLRRRQSEPYAAGCLLAGLAALAAARPLTAVRMFDDCLPTLHSERQSGLAPVIMELQSSAYQLAGRPADAEASHRQAVRALESMAPPGGDGSERADGRPDAEEWVGLIRAVTLDVRGDRPAAYDLAAAGCRRARADGHVLIELLGLRLQQSIRSSETVLSRILTLSATTQGPVLESFGEHAVATASRDAGRLAKLADSLDRSGLPLLAADTAVSALAADDTDLPTPETLGCRRLLRRLGAGPQLVLPGWWLPGPGRPGPSLTHREREIMTAVVGGRTSAEVAAGLCLSRRTVENHLQHIYTKLGISSRAELGQLGGVPITDGV